MSEDLLYKVRVTVEDGSDIPAIEEKMEALLLELYDAGSVESILVKDRTPPIDDDMDEIVDILDELDSDDIRRAMDFVKEMEDLDDE